MRKDHRKNDVVFLVTADQFRDSRIVGLLRKQHGQDVEIHIRNSPKVLNRLHGLNSLVHQLKNRGKVYVVMQDISRDHIAYAMNNGSSFGIISRKSTVGGQMSVAWFYYRGKLTYDEIAEKLKDIFQQTAPALPQTQTEKVAVGAAS